MQEMLLSGEPVYTTPLTTMEYSTGCLFYQGMLIGLVQQTVQIVDRSCLALTI